MISGTSLIPRAHFFRTKLQLRIQDFREWAPTLRVVQTYYSAKFYSENYIEMKIIGPKGRKYRVAPHTFQGVGTHSGNPGYATDVMSPISTFLSVCLSVPCPRFFLLLFVALSFLKSVREYDENERNRYTEMERRRDKRDSPSILSYNCLRK